MSGSGAGRRAAVLGAAAATAFGDLEATWAGFRSGRSALEAGRGLEASDFGASGCGYVPDSAPEADDPAERILGFHGRLLGACARAAHDAGGGAALARDDLGLYVAGGMVDSTQEDLGAAILASRDGEAALDLGRFFASGFRSIHPLWPLTMLNNVGVGQVATDLAVRGDNTVLGSEADSGVRAFEEALAALAAGAVRAALVGGVSDRVQPWSLARHAQRGGSSRAPLGEGAGVLFLGPADPAGGGAARPLGFVRGAAGGFGTDPSGVGPSSRTLERVVRLALEEAGAGPAGVRAVFGDPLAGDVADLRARRYDTRAAFGHLLAGAPAVDAALALRVLASEGPGSLAVVVGASSAGGAGALVLEGPP